MRSLIFTLWLKAGKDVDATIKLVEQLVVEQYDIVKVGGARIVRSSVAGKSFDFELPANWSSADLAEALREAYKLLLTGGASGGQITQSELSDYVLDVSNQVSDTAVAVFAINGGRY